MNNFYYLFDLCVTFFHSYYGAFKPFPENENVFGRLVLLNFEFIDDAYFTILCITALPWIKIMCFICFGTVKSQVNQQNAVIYKTQNTQQTKYTIIPICEK